MWLSTILDYKRSSYFRPSAAAISLIFLCLFGFADSARAQGSNHVGQLFVRVHDRLNEDPLAQAQVQLIRFPDGIVGEQFTGSDGGVQFTGISVGAYTIRVSHQGYETGEAHVDFRRGDGSLQSVDIPMVALSRDRTAATRGTISADYLRIPENARKEFERGAKLLNERKQPRESITAFEKAIELFPQYPAAFLLLGTAHLQLGEIGPAEESLRKAISLDPRSTHSHYPLAMLLFGQKRYEEEKKLLLDAKKLDGSDWRWPFELARCEAQQQNWESALKYAIESSQLPKAGTKVHLLLGDIYSNSGRIKEAIDELELFVRLDPQSPYAARVTQVVPELRKQLTANAATRP